MTRSANTSVLWFARFVQEILGARLGVEQCEYSVYSYRPQTFEDTRIEKRAPIQHIRDHVYAESESLAVDQELAFHSRCWVQGEVRHLPMVDFACRSISLIHKVYKEAGLHRETGPLFLFDSGRSFHGYGLKLLTAEEWPQFMGSLLLLNPPNTHAFVDSRWIGHRLRAGYSSLRWTANTDWYLKAPQPVAVVGDDLRYIGTNDAEAAHNLAEIA